MPRKFRIHCFQLFYVCDHIFVFTFFGRLLSKLSNRNQFYITTKNRRATLDQRALLSPRVLSRPATASNEALAPTSSRKRSVAAPFNI